MTFLLVIDHIFYDFPCLYCVKCDITYMALSSREKLTISEKNSFVHDTFFTLFLLLHACDNVTSLNIGGRMHGPSPHLKFFGGPSPQSKPKSPPMPGTMSLLCSNFLSHCYLSITGLRAPLSKFL